MARKKTYTKKTKEEKVKNAIDHLLRNVEAMTDAEYKEYLDRVSLGNHNYSWSNTMLAYAQFYKHYGKLPTLLGGAKTFFAKKGRRVKYSEYGKKGLWILVPIFSSFTKEEKTADGSAKKTKVKYISNFRSMQIYDISQTEGDEIVIEDKVKKDNPDLNLSEMVRFFNESKLGVSIEIKKEYSSTGGYVTPTGYLRLNSLYTEGANKSTLFHELAHWVMGHTKDMNYYRANRAQCEVDAETLAYCLGQRYGIEASATEYLFSWRKEKKITPRFDDIMKGFNKISALMDKFINGEVEEEKEEAA